MVMVAVEPEPLLGIHSRWDTVPPHTHTHTEVIWSSQSTYWYVFARWKKTHMDRYLEFRKDSELRIDPGIWKLWERVDINSEIIGVILKLLSCVQQCYLINRGITAEKKKHHMRAPSPYQGPTKSHVRPNLWGVPASPVLLLMTQREEYWATSLGRVCLRQCEAVFGGDRVCV